MPASTEPAESARPRSPKTSRFGTFRYSAVELLIVLGLLFLATPFIEDLPAGDLIEAILVTCVMISAVLAVGGRRRTLLFALSLVTPAVCAKWASRLFPGELSSLLYELSATIFFGFIVIYLVRSVLRAPRVDANVLCAGLSGYILLGLLWVPAYVLVARLNPAAFNISQTSGSSTMDGFNAFYFSFITLCTVGYGDLTPVSKPARMLAVTEAITGLFYVAVLISRLVALYSSRPPSPPPTD